MFSVLGFHAALLMGLLIQGCRQEPTGSNSGSANPLAASDDANQPAAESPANAAAATPPARPPAPLLANAPMQVHARAFTPLPAGVTPPGTKPSPQTAAPAPASPVAPTTAAAAPQPPQSKPFPQITTSTPASPAAPVTAKASAPSPTTVAPQPPPSPTPQFAATALPAPPITTGTDYTVLAGDTFGKIAKSLHTNVKALATANPGVNSAKLRIGQKIHLPAGSEVPAQAMPVQATAAPATPVRAAAAPSLAASNTAGPADEQLYTVQHGDYLFKIAKQFGIKASAIREANGLKKDQLTVGQKLKIPAKVSPTPTRATASAATASPAVPRAGA